ncbi:MAG: PhoH family protein [Verrucomicrobia bacterium]|nr:PhoH family protein [Verrucomicrobiota bacterium]
MCSATVTERESIVGTTCTTSLAKQNNFTGVKKTYVLDTNVLIHDPESLFKFDEHIVAVPVEVLSELDRLKTQPGQLGASARRVNRSIRSLFENRPLKDIAEGDPTKPGALHAALHDGGELRVVVNESLIRDHFNGSRSDRLRAVFMQVDAPDHRIIASALYLRDTADGPVVLVTKDACMALKAQALGLEVQDYRNDRVETSDVGDYKTLTISAASMHDFRDLAQVEIKLKDEELPVINEYVMLASDSWSEPARHVGEGAFVPLGLYREFLSTDSGARKGLQMPRGMRVIPKNFEQWIFLDALLNPDIKLVTCFGRAGTGKTFLSIAAALSQVLSDFSPYKKLYVSRPVVQIGKDIGALPGTKEEKLSPYIQPYFDNLEVLFSKNGAPPAPMVAKDTVATDSQRKQKKAQALKAAPPIFGSQFQQVNQPRKPYQWLIDSGLIEIEAMTFIRGRSIGHAFMIVDEAQNMTPHEAKTVITRIGEGSKVVLIGDLDQVDTPYLDGKSNGLIHTHERMKGYAITANVRLLHGVRSALSELAAKAM